MLDALYTAASGMLAQETGLDVIANNLANINTVGFKTQRAAFEDLLYNTIATNQGAAQGQQMGLGVAISGIQAQFDEGAQTPTGQQTDFMITGGQGFFAVRKPDGTIAYTRAGNFGIDGAGQLVTQQGDFVLDKDGKIFKVPADTKRLEMSGKGELIAVRQGDVRQTLGTMQIAVFINPAGLEPMGQNQYLETANSGKPAVTPNNGNGGTILQGFLEQSNVRAVDEMVNMITTQRAFESVAKIVQASDEMLGTANGLRR